MALGNRMQTIRIFRVESDGEKLFTVTQAVSLRAALKYYSTVLVEFGNTDPKIVGRKLTVKDKQGNTKTYIGREV
jgi:hypothetical protein